MTEHVFYLDGKWGNLCVASEKIGYPFTITVDATLDNLRSLGKCEIVIHNHEKARGKLWRCLRELQEDGIVVTMR
jgi:hypothetical protein